MAYDQLQIHSINRASGVYELRLNFDDNVKWTSTGSTTRIHSQRCLISTGTITSSRLMENLQNALGSLKVELSDYPELVYDDGTGNIIRECFETARTNGYLVHAILARYSNETTPVFQEYVFAGSYDPREMTVAHRRWQTGVRRSETISCEFSAAKRLDVALGNIAWDVSDLQSNVRPFWLSIGAEPSDKGNMWAQRMLPKKLTEWVIHGTGEYDFFGTSISYTYDPKKLTHEIAYGSHAFTVIDQNISNLRDTVGDGTATHPSATGGIYPAGNWAIKWSTAIDKLFSACNIVWDGVFPDGLQFRYAHFENSAEIYEDDGEMSPDLIFLSWNYVFGFNPYDGSNFKGPCTFDSDMVARDFLKASAAQLKSRIDINGYDADGLPIARFISFGQTTGAFPDLERLDESGEDSFVTDKDGVRITRRGFDGAVIAPADSRSPVDIEIPFAPFAIGFETAPCYDASRLTPNAALEFQDQWKCGFRGSINSGGTSETVYPLNPDGWVVGSHLFRFGSDTAMTQFPSSHDSSGHDGDNETFYQAGGWQGYYPVYAVYDVDRGDLKDAERRDRQKNYLISYALAYGRYLRGERRRLTIQFKGCVAPMWSDIANGQTYNFTPVDSSVEYVAVEIERNIDDDIITVHFEESTPATMAITYRIDGDQKGSGSIGGQGKTDGDSGSPPLTNETLSLVRFYQAGVVVKEITMAITKTMDSTTGSTLALSGACSPSETDVEGMNARFFFHYKGTEYGNVEIVGLSPTDTPDYWVSGIGQFKNGPSLGTDDSSIDYHLENFFWSEDQGDFLMQRLLEVANLNRRIWVAGRFICDRITAPGSFGGFVWQTLSTAFPMSETECYKNIDLGLFATTAAAPTLIGRPNDINIKWGTRYKPVTITAKAWGYNTTVNAHDWQIGANPVLNQQPTTHDVTINFWLNDWAALAGSRHLILASGVQLDLQPQLDYYIVEFEGTLEIIGDDATLA